MKESDLSKVEKDLLQRVLDTHRDAGPTWGYCLDGIYRAIEHSCEACSKGLFRVEWPCRFVIVIKENYKDDLL